MKTFNDHEERPRFLSINQVAKTKLFSNYTLRKLNEENRLPAIKVGKRTLINYDLLLKQLNSLEYRKEAGE